MYRKVFIVPIDSVGLHIKPYNYDMVVAVVQRISFKVIGGMLERVCKNKVGQADKYHTYL